MIDDGSMPDYQGMHDEDFTFRLYIDGYTRFSVRMPYFYSHEEFLRDFRSFEHAFEEYDLKTSHSGSAWQNSWQLPSAVKPPKDSATS